MDAFVTNQRATKSLWCPMRAAWVGLLGLLLALIGFFPVQGKTATIGFCATPTILPRNTPLHHYSPLLCFAYSGLAQEQYSLKAWLLETATGNYLHGSDHWRERVFLIDNRNGTNSSGKITVVEQMNVFDYASFRWLIRLYNQAGAEVLPYAESNSKATTNRAPVLNPIAEKLGVLCQPVEFTLTAADQENETLNFKLQKPPAGATLEPTTGKFVWPCPPLGVYMPIFQVEQSGEFLLNDAEKVTIRIVTPTPTPTSTPPTPTKPAASEVDVICQKAYLPWVVGALGNNLTTPLAPTALPAGDGAARAYQHLRDVMDQYHKTFDIYTDLAAAGNHFIHRAAISNTVGSVEISDGFTGTVYAGSTAIRNVFTATHHSTWGGWYFQVGVLEGSESIPKDNWGTFPNAGYDLTDSTQLTFWARGEQGGERVEFFAFGIGRKADGTPEENHPYPDSEAKVTICGRLSSACYVTLTNTWQPYTITLSTLDLSYVIGGFGWVTAAAETNNQNLTFYLDDIRYDLARLDAPRFLLSFATLPTTDPFDTVLKNVSFVYDDALALMNFANVGDWQRAKLIADAFRYAQEHDRYYSDGRLRNAYQAGDLTVPPGWKPLGVANSTRPPGWWETPNQVWREDVKFDSSDTGNMAWVILALLTYYENQGGQEYLDTASKLAEWVQQHTVDTRGAGGYMGGYAGFEPNPEKQLWKSTEHNLDLLVAFERLFRITHQSKWHDRSEHARKFVEAMWNDSCGFFATGTTTNGVTINQTVIPLDGQTWALMVLGRNTWSERAIAYAETHHNAVYQRNAQITYEGFDFNTNRDGPWLEGTGQMVVAYKLLGESAKAQHILAEMREIQATAANTNQQGIVAAPFDSVDTGFDWHYYNRLHIGATAWFIMAEQGYNPYWHVVNPLVVE